MEEFLHGNLEARVQVPDAAAMKICWIDGEGGKKDRVQIPAEAEKLVARLSPAQVETDVEGGSGAEEIADSNKNRSLSLDLGNPLGNWELGSQGSANTDLSFASASSTPVFEKVNPLKDASGTTNNDQEFNKHAWTLVTRLTKGARNKDEAAKLSERKRARNSPEEEKGRVTRATVKSRKTSIEQPKWK